MMSLSQHLKALGVEKIYFCSGARNFPLLEVLNSFNIEHEFDERVAAFMALGECKATTKPVVVCTTSGTAVAECLPAVIEAYYSDQPLIIISADRPERLRETHAPQAINQTNIFSHFVKSKYIGPLENYRDQKIDFPFHVNIEVDDQKDFFQKPHEQIQDKNVIDLISHSKKPLFLFTEDSQNNQEYFNHLLKTGAFLYKECTANIHGRNDYTIKYEHTLVSMLKNKQFDVIVKIGKTPISKIWRLLDQYNFDLKIINLSNYPSGLSYGLNNPNKKLLLEIQKEFSCDKIEENNLDHIANSYNQSEPYVLKEILCSLQTNSFCLLGNSMPVRYGQMFYREDLKYHSLRGANGIDGLIATSIGFAKNTDKDIHLILGDLSFLYDVGALNRQVPSNLYIHVLNNQGGRIFERIKLPKLIQNEHEHNFEDFSSFYSHINLKIYQINNEQTEKFWKEIQ